MNAIQDSIGRVEKGDFWAQADAILRGDKWMTVPVAVVVRRLVWNVAIFGAVYGAAMGCFGFNAERAPQVLFAALKVPLLLLVAGGLTVPCFFVLYTLWGLRDDFPVVLRALAATQSALSIILASLAPFTLVWYLSVPAQQSYDSSVLFNATMFAIASLSAQALLRHHMRPLLRREPRHSKMLRWWIVLYGFIGIQMGWLLRPFIGETAIPITFFRAEAMGNAYVVLWQMAARTLGW